jgi:hypothetical protein
MRGTGLVPQPGPSGASLLRTCSTGLAPSLSATSSARQGPLLSSSTRALNSPGDSTPLYTCERVHALEREGTYLGTGRGALCGARSWAGLGPGCRCCPLYLQELCS